MRNNPKGNLHPNWIDGRAKDKLWIYARQNIRRLLLKYLKIKLKESKVDPFFSGLRYNDIWRHICFSVWREDLIIVEYWFLKAKEELNEYNKSNK